MLQSHTCAGFMATLYITATIQTQSINKQIDGEWVHTVRYCLVTEKKEILPFVSKQKDDMLSKISEDQKKNPHYLIHVCNFKIFYS